ncbi:HP1 family phage holin [Quatrionicoccus australiensis]|uniref:HP1 family phage holin n=1 Tax=Quatrionicoccus australiensis TaxID=138118 RepID=UPI001CF9BE3D|nr:hypothetical protein [Quatrionicoccus australiensis]
MSDPKTTVASYAASAGAVVFGLTANEIAAYVGMACAVATFVVNWYYKRQHLKLIESRVIPFPSIQSEEI